MPPQTRFGICLAGALSLSCWCPIRDGISAEVLCADAAADYPCSGDDCVVLHCADWGNNGYSNDVPVICNQRDTLATVVVSSEYLSAFEGICGETGFSEANSCPESDTGGEDSWVVACYDSYPCR
jgi:hypothetical protein